MKNPLEEIPDVWGFSDDTNGEGIYYVLCRLYLKGEKDDITRYVVAVGGSSFGHSYVASNFWHYNIEGRGIHIDVQGGGFMTIRRAQKKITVLGESEGYGRADHTKTAEILRKYLGNWEVTTE